MTTEEKQIGRIKAVMSAAEDVVRIAAEKGDRNVALIAKETAYHSVKGILEDPAYNPWQE